MTHELPLDGITVVSIEQAISAPLASRHLANRGARLIKIEREVSGDFCRNYDYGLNGISSQFVWTNRGRESIGAAPVIGAIPAAGEHTEAILAKFRNTPESRLDNPE